MADIAINMSNDGSTSRSQQDHIIQSESMSVAMDNEGLAPITTEGGMTPIHNTNDEHIQMEPITQCRNHSVIDDNISPHHNFGDLPPGKQSPDELCRPSSVAIFASPELNMQTCKLCLDVHLAEQMYQLDQCNCVFCEQCMAQYVEVMICEGNVLSITCPDGQCNNNSHISDIQISQLCSHSLFKRYKRLKFEREVDLDPARTFCPAPGCSYICYLDTDMKNALVAVTCEKCGHQFCSSCKQNWHPDKECDMTDLELLGITDPVEESNIKSCPKCHILIEREEGCAQMHCKRCHHLFCWYCLASLDKDFMLRHYDSGPCKNRLGHDRANIIWHRIQVVGLFAGFSVLFLIACPFLVLALPCIICCKLKCKCMPDLDDPEKD